MPLPTGESAIKFSRTKPVAGGSSNDQDTKPSNTQNSNTNISDQMLVDGNAVQASQPTITEADGDESSRRAIILKLKHFSFDE